MILDILNCINPTYLARKIIEYYDFLRRNFWNSLLEAKMKKNSSHYIKSFNHQVICFLLILSSFENKIPLFKKKDGITEFINNLEKIANRK